MEIQRKVESTPVREVRDVPGTAASTSNPAGPKSNAKHVAPTYEYSRSAERPEPGARRGGADVSALHDRFAPVPALEGGIATLFRGWSREADAPMPKPTAPRDTPFDALEKAPAYALLLPPQREALRSAFDACGKLGRAHLLGLLQQRLGTTPLLQTRDSRGRSLVDNLAAFAALKRPGGEARGRALDELLQLLDQPQLITQGPAGTCSVTGAQYILSRARPAEVVRVLTGLLGPKGRATLVDGSEVPLPGTALAWPDERALVSRAWQGAMIDFCEGRPDTWYSAREDAFIDRKSGKPTGAGVPLGQEARLYEAFLGRSPTRLDAAQAGPSLASLPAGTPMVIAWNNTGHTVVLERVENGRAYFWNPQGSSALEVGARRGPRGSQLENPALSLESMSLESLALRMPASSYALLLDR